MNSIIKKNGITYGIISGVISALITTMIYTIDLKLFLSGWITFLKLCVFLTLAIILLTSTKKQLKDEFSFKNAFTTYFIFIVIASLITTFFEIILFNIIDPSLKETLKEMAIKYATEILEKFGTPTSKLNEAIKNIQENDQFSVIQLIKGFFTYILISSIFGLILAAIFKTNNKNFN
ncbi:DUF4199 domain-containing protein [Flavobacterium aciduliphilum]|uniref:Uncharacterized protein DUF4199 n=1 Tax=Flavobacterium aciduliphilum TaxID=1101402 RepID=A0A328YQ37_9FLAO|nr:DUF4199 domain-containing protein [Flavobacterium aciduliphilum]RAR75740.1 uncharacterized protein DUF4199 [Flavobacterium aciduliphilum]